MAKRSPKPSEGETRFGPATSGKAGQGTFYLESGVRQGDVNDAGLGSVLALDGRDSSGNTTTVYLWVSTDGKLRTGTTYPTNTEAGTVVGSQS